MLGVCVCVCVHVHIHRHSSADDVFFMLPIHVWWHSFQCQKTFIIPNDAHYYKKLQNVKTI